jgi:hypothetical protein
MERLNESQLNAIEAKIVAAEVNRGGGGQGIVVLGVRTARALYDLARRAPLPAVDRGLDEIAGLLAKEGT